jgi:hypothetical protein
MNEIKETFTQFIETSGFGFFSKLLSIILSVQLDKFMDDSISNIIGLILNGSIDFFMMKWVFKKDIEESSHFVSRYAITLILGIVASQIIFMGIYEYVKIRHRIWYSKHWKGKWVSVFRWIAGAFGYALVEFPLYKYWVFR